MSDHDNHDKDNNTDEADEVTHIYKRKKDGIEIDARDPIQDIMSDKELDEAHSRLMDLIEGDDNNSDNS